MTYSKNLIFGNDYYISKDQNGTLVNFSETGTKPKNESVFFISYTWYLHRIDLVYLTEDGYIAIKKGIPNEYELVLKPTIPCRHFAIGIYFLFSPKSILQIMS